MDNLREADVSVLTVPVSALATSHYKHARFAAPVALVGATNTVLARQSELHHRKV